MKKIILCVITSLTCILSAPLITQASPLVYSTERIAGQDRVETALKISQKGWDSAQTVILCEYSDYPDSIASTPFAVSLDAPILLTAGNSIDPRVLQELQRLKPQKVILLGGIACLQPSIEKELDNSSLKWERIGGIDRYETSVLLAKRLSSDSLILANGDNFPDALSAATYAGIKQIPIVLTSTTLPDSVIQYYQEAGPKHLIVIGGEVVVPSIELTKNKFSVETRLGGQDRYQTNAKVVTYMKGTYKSNDLFLASGITFPDAVAGTVLASKVEAPLLLTEKEDIPPSVYSLMREHMQVEPPSESSDSSANPSKKGKVNATGSLNLRDTPSPTGKTLVTIPNGTTIDLTEQQGQWYKTTYQSKTGWISADYITVISTPLTPSDDSDTKTTDNNTSNQSLKGEITASGGLNLRDTPSPTGATLATIPKGTALDLTDHQGQWYKTTYQSKTGWISADYVTIISTPKGEITASGGLNLRDTPSPTGKTLITIPKGTTLDLTDLQGQWYKTTYQSKTGWVSAAFVTSVSPNKISSISSTTTATNKISSTTTIDLSVNGRVYILGGTGIISSNTQNIIQGKASSKYKDNLKSFPSLPSEIKKPDPPSSDNDGDVTPPPSDNSTVPTTYDPSSEVLIDPFQGIPANALAGKTIMIDPGHGGPDTGAIGPKHTNEKDNTLAISLVLNNILKQAGAQVILTRDTDICICPVTNYSETADLQARVDLANKYKPDLFICIHNDSFTNPDVQGTSTFYSKENLKENESIQLASNIESSLIDTIKTKNRGVKEARDYVLRYTSMPAVLLETAFISNPYEEARLQNPTFQKNVASAIFHGIYNYYKNPLPKA
ncbi:N-acetylmuramoyl-L-alanine amidase [Desulfosporosinus sp. BG]|uniref:N-acetylmuramoyl-L-alanine amidase n=1 Tax=Desulfosporosinus sp. BG TaxID=1633135 RepID=UPI00083A237E|nr:N-acetylmuramoyl-L-alanine amidase [Desulfosporosinus sp. BG]ODA39073.1 N-acetylmuramoyl-L-alanine amidase [Desulfosporosinus sp. BG]